MRNNGCWPFYHGQVLVDQESDEEDNSDIVRRELGIPGASGLQGRTRPTPKEAANAVMEEADEIIRRQLGIPGASGLQGRTRPTPKEAANAVMEEADEFVVPKSDLKNFSAYDPEEEPRGEYIEDSYVPDSTN